MRLRGLDARHEARRALTKASRDAVNAGLDQGDRAGQLQVPGLLAAGLGDLLDCQLEVVVDGSSVGHAASGVWRVRNRVIRSLRLCRRCCSRGSRLGRAASSSVMCVSSARSAVTSDPAARADAVVGRRLLLVDALSLCMLQTEAVPDMHSVSNDVGGYVVGNVVQGGVVTVAAPASRPIAVAGLPAQAVFVGREHELAQLVDALKPLSVVDNAPPAVLVWSVGGLPGVGKTALAVRAAHDAVAAGWFPGGVVMANLRGYDQPGQRVSASTALVGLLGALGVPSEHIPPELEDRAWLWRSILAERADNGQRMLVIADNVSHPDQVRPLLPGTAVHRVLITSRHRLAELDGTRLVDLGVLDPVESARMLSAVVAISDPVDARVTSDSESTDRVARLCGGLPLAVRVSAALLVAEPEQSMAGLADALADGRRRLAELRYDGSLSVRAAFDLSYEHLEPSQACLFRLMALHPGPDMGIDAIAAVGGVHETMARRLLRQLRRAHLVQAGSSADRWRMHDLLRLHGAEKAADDPGDRDEAIIRLLEHYLDHVRAAYDHTGEGATHVNPRFSGRGEALAWLDAEHVNLVAMVDLAHTRSHLRYVVDLAADMYDYFDLRKHWNEWISTQELGLKSAEQLGDLAAEATFLVNLGLAHRQSMRLEVALALFRRALPVCRALGDRVGFGRALNHLGLTLRSLGRSNFAMLCHQWALTLFREAGHGYHECSALHNIAVGYRLLGRLDIAVEFHLQSVAIYRALGDRLYLGRALDFLGVVYRELGRMDEAIVCHRRNLEICGELFDVHGAARSNANLAVTYREAGRWAAAIACHLEALRTFRATGPRHREGAVLVELSRTYRRCGRYADGIRCGREAIEILESIPGHGPAVAEQTRASLVEFEEMYAFYIEQQETSGTQVSVHHEPTHRLSQARFDQLCAGAVDAQTVTILWNGQHSRRRLLLSALIAELNGRERGPAEDLERAWEIITAADRSTPVVLAKVLMSPLVGVWLARILRRLRGAARDGPRLSVELDYLGSLAAAVAIRSQSPCVLTVPAVDGVVTLPTVGQVRFSGGAGVVPATVTVTSGGAEVRAELADGTAAVCAVPGGTEFFSVQELEFVGQGHRLAVELDDSTPYREFSAPIGPQPLSSVERSAWITRLEQAWQIITRWHPEFAAEISVGLTTLTPMQPTSKIVATSSPMSFGAIAVSTADSAESLAETLVHELQHSKLNAALDLVRLHTDTTASWYAPWRDDPRPLSGLLHGIYAFTSAVEFWQVQRHHVPATAATHAMFRFAYRHKQVQNAIDAVQPSLDLTSLGRELVVVASQRLRRCALDDVPAQFIDLIDTIMVEHRATWRLRHLRPDTDHVTNVLSAWSAKEPAPTARSQQPAVIPFRRTVLPSNRARLLTARKVDLLEPSGAGADVAFAVGAYDDAADGYVQRLRSAPDDGDAWVGLGLTLRAAGNIAAARAFLDLPETASTAWQRLVKESPVPPSPVEFGHWLGGR